MGLHSSRSSWHNQETQCMDTSRRHQAASFESVSSHNQRVNCKQTHITLKQHWPLQSKYKINFDMQIIFRLALLNTFVAHTKHMIGDF
ncbi:Os11g0432301 [Oryza sativa Japonica Group]|uniref:Os11g0432301 protein n=1 Tax=Oryza sativa subsp. japonica TaxID=39947 RepID=A0A0P0Y1N9_ORYSJ|nr:hypothetical protein EE612_055178 [Oryza sativa]BAT13820.1 Os11g0432301 [Oryza sativa Japonica Group]